SLVSYLTDFSKGAIHQKALTKLKMKIPFRQNGEHMYRGQVAFRIEGEKNARQMDAYLVRVLKAFGDEEQEIWEVRFDPFQDHSL
ncbi:MAG: hypothetical protein WBA74_08345, partial [Cyclobacteriaceae bacterium]